MLDEGWDAPSGEALTVLTSAASYSTVLATEAPQLLSSSSEVTTTGVPLRGSFTQ